LLKQRSFLLTQVQWRSQDSDKDTCGNNDFAFMGDKAKREFSDQYNADIKPGETYEIPIQMTIPEKVSGVRPAGDIP